jgi:hypothetical protein
MVEENPLIRFYKQLEPDKQALIKDYLSEKSLESLSKSFDELIRGQEDEAEGD